MEFLDNDDNWEAEVGFPNRHLIDHRPSKSREKDIETILQRFRFLPSVASDDETDSTFTSHHSDKLSVNEYDQLLLDIDDYMYDVPSPPLLHTTVPGIPTKLGSGFVEAGGSEHWNDDLEAPQKLSEPCLSAREDLIDLFDDQPDKRPRTKQVHFETEGEDTHNHRSPSLMNMFCEPETENETYDDIEFPQDMASIAAPKAPLAEEVEGSRRTLIEDVAEQKEEDFFDGLHIDNDNVFNIASKSSKSVPQRQSDPVSRLPRRIVPPRHQTAAKPTQPERFRAPTYASRQRELATTNASPRLPDRSIQPSRTMGRWTDRLNQNHRQQFQSKGAQQQRPQPPSARRGFNGTVLMERPFTRVAYGNGSELDDLDDLSDWREAQGQRTTRPEYNKMKYDEANCVWRGNENSILSFDQDTAKQRVPRQPALIRPKQNIQQASKYNIAMVNNMKFDQATMRWENTLVDTDDDPLASISDLEDDDHPRYPAYFSSGGHTTKGIFGHGNEFEISQAIQRQMSEEENEHQEYMKYWPLDLQEGRGK
ncbi:hypothetical protein EC973_009252 [Apophysomyces ossiformis]|uniref:Uncharacterized protein n=1 Tax=Apophysomyces ossiformis TaxID=679940 RepID=A0A8H7BS70_9FUNG|nr:hypothetical protein EC973_009252 [Apophysomyces ossiformis]